LRLVLEEADGFAKSQPHRLPRLAPDLKALAMGTLHRRIEVVVRPAGDDLAEARAVVEDDFHHFRVTLRARDGRLVEAVSEAPRYPTSLCPAAGDRLSELVGLELTPAAAAVNEAVDPRQQCTHVFDIAALAVAALAQKRPHRIYEAAVSDPEDEHISAELKRDGETVLAWKLKRARILAPEPYAGRTVGSGFTPFARTLPPEETEAALVLRRAVFVAGGRRVADSGQGGPPVGGCWVFQPERVNLFERRQGVRFDFTGRPQDLAVDDQDWLKFAE